MIGRKIATLLTRALRLVENHQSQIYKNMIEIMLKSWQSISNKESCVLVEQKTEAAKNEALFIYFSTRIPMVSIKKQNF